MKCLIRNWVNGLVFVKDGWRFDWKLFIFCFDFLVFVGFICIENED